MTRIFGICSLLVVAFLICFLLVRNWQKSIYPQSSIAIQQQDGKKTTNINKLLSEAESGNPNSQVALAFAYYAGLGGVKVDYNKSTQWLLKAAEQGYPEAEYFLFNGYYWGSGMQKDWIKAHMWLDLLLEQNNPQVILFRKQTATQHAQLDKSMTPQQIDEAKKLSEVWKKEHPYLNKPQP